MTDSIRERFERELSRRGLGFVLVVIPCRDFLYALVEGSPLLSRIGLRVSDEGIEAIGHFPV